MESVENKVVLVTGGNRGFGLGIAEALAARGAKVFTLSRRASERPNPKITELIGDATDEALRDKFFAEHAPDILVLNAGSLVEMTAPHKYTWESFSAIWNNDLKHSFLWSQKAMQAPMKPGSTVLVISSGAAVQGSPLSGGYAGAKRMQWFLSNYLQLASDRHELGLRFRALLPRALSPETEIGRHAVSVYSKVRGVSEAEYFESFGPPLTCALVGEGVREILERSAPEGRVYTITGKGLEVLEA